MIEHLIVSTVILGLAMLAARLLPVTARTRHAILVCGLAKFAIPTSLLDAFGLKAIEVAPMPLRIFDGTANVATPAAATTNWLLIGWALVAAIVLARWLLLRERTVTSALRSPAPPSQREIEALADARRLLGVRTSIDIIRSPICEAPAVLRVVRPVVILPARGCDDLTDDELRALLLHEVAHVARRDNLTAAFGALAASLLWFHPLVWLALRQIDAAREQACDERVSESMGRVESYLEALTKVCRALIAPRTAGASCMAGANVKERMEHLMRYETLRKRAWSHRGVLAVAIIAVIAATAIAATPAKNEQLYSLQFNITPLANQKQVRFEVSVIEIATGTAAANPRVTAPIGEWASVTENHNGRTIEVRMRMPKDRPAELFLTVTSGGEVIQRNLYTWQPEASEFSGEPIDLTLKDADLHDVMKTFGQITGLKIEVAPEIEAKVTIDVRRMPWDQAMMEIAKRTGTKITIENKTIHVTK